MTTLVASEGVFGEKFWRIFFAKGILPFRSGKCKLIIKLITDLA